MEINEVNDKLKGRNIKEEDKQEIGREKKYE